MIPQRAGTASRRPATQYVGRFAPSPTGPLHFGSLLAALASFLDAHAHGGRWLVRMEDIDPPREQPGAAQAILRTLAEHGLRADDTVLWQSQRSERYRAAADRLIDAGAAFFCSCSRAQLATSGGIHRGRCRDGDEPPIEPTAIRIHLPPTEEVGFTDRIQGYFRQSLGVVGDFVIWRKDDLPAYQLAVVLDDADQGVTDVVRGSDLLDNTPRQIFLQRLLGLPTLRHAHIPVIANRDGQKLSKQTFAVALQAADALANLRAALAFLGQTEPPHAAQRSVAALLRWAVDQWQIARVPARLALSGDALPSVCRRFAT